MENLISVATLIRAYLAEKKREINTRSYMFIRKCRVVRKIAKNVDLGNPAVPFY